MNLIAGRSETIQNLPSPLEGCKNAADWICRRRKEIIREYEEIMFGKVPPRPESVRFEITREKKSVFDGLGLRREVTIHLENNGCFHEADALWYLPEQPSANIPVIVGLNFHGNATVTNETDLPLDSMDITHGQEADRWQIPMLLKAGFSVITAPRNSFFPDHENGRPNSIFALYHPESELTQEHREYTAISAWAFAYSLLLELALTEDRVDPRRIWAHGHSRLGKTALWAGANDLRFAGIVSNDSGCCGASLFREKHPDAETIAKFAFHWWVRDKLDSYASCVDAPPLDQHFLTALTAPRPLLIASASEDVWADAFNEFRCARATSAVYKLFGADGIGDAHFPPVNEPLYGDRLGYYQRQGPHGVTKKDWEFVLEFIRRNS